MPSPLVVLNPRWWHRVLHLWFIVLHSNNTWPDSTPVFGYRVPHVHIPELFDIICQKDELQKIVICKLNETTNYRMMSYFSSCFPLISLTICARPFAGSSSLWPSLPFFWNLWFSLMWVNLFAKLIDKTAKVQNLNWNSLDFVQKSSIAGKA